MGLRQLKNVDARRMVGDLSNRQTLMWVGVALVVHVVLIGATSMGYIRDRWIDPEGAEARRQAAAAASEPTPATQPATAPAPAPAKPQAAKATARTDADEKRLLEERKDSKVVRDITEPAKPEEIPKEPSRKGFDLDEELN